jgi:hypothetical protein
MQARENVTEKTLEIIKEQQNKPLPADVVNKAWTQPGSATTGINAYDLTPAARILYPVITPLRNMIPRVPNGVGTAANWRSITGINTANLSAGLQERDRGGIISTTVLSLSAPYAGLGFDDYVTYEADFAAKTFDDVKALAVEGLLRSLMIYEEKTILGGFATQSLGTTATPTLADVGTGGILLANTTYRVICVALTNEGYMSSVLPPAASAFPQAASIPGQVTRTNADGTTTTYGGGSAQQSATASVATANDSNNTHSITATVAVKAGAVAYAWFLGTTGGTERLAAVSTINSVVLTALNSSGQLASAVPNVGSDNSQNAYVFDGLFAQVITSGSNSYFRSLATGTPGTGTKLTSSGYGTVTEIDTALQTFWNTYKLAPTHMFVSAQEMLAINSLCIGNNGNPLYRINAMANAANVNVAVGQVVTSYLNMFTYAGNQEIKVILHPNVPAGTILFYTDRIPYPLSNVVNPIQMKLRRDYYQIEWPITRRSYDYGVYMDGLLQNYFPPSFGILCNIAPQ